MSVDSDTLTTWKCPDCGYKSPIPVRPGQRVYHDCTARPSSGPGIVTRALNYMQALNRWRLAGCPRRSKEQIAYLLQHFCEPCEENIGGNCRVCGCCVNSLQFPVANKLAMATESCPQALWQAEEAENHG